MKRLTTIGLSLFLALAVNAQSYKVKVIDKDYRVDKITRPGLAVIINADKKLVESLWKKEFKKYGKSHNSGKVGVIDQASIPQVSSRTVRSMSTVETANGGVMVWMAVDMGDTWVKSGTKGYSALEQLLHDFGKDCYRTAIMEEVEASEDALAKTVKEQEKMIKEGDNLVKAIETNGQDKTSLETKLEENAAELIELEKTLEQNKLDQDEATNQVAEKEKAVNITKDKLNQID